jgi:hypothetical protein
MKRKIAFVLSLIILISLPALAQNPADLGRFSGNFQLDAQYYLKDSVIGAKDIPSEKILSNSFLNLMYNMSNFEIGLRYEAYINPISGFDPLYKGQDISYRYVTYTSEKIDITAGNFYEQFGSGLIFRAYEERTLGIDNAMDGARVRFRPLNGISLTGLVGKQRLYWGLGQGIVRAGDIGIALNTVLPDFLPPDYQITIGGSFVSKYEDTVSTYYNLPPNVFSYSTRLNVSGSFFSLDAEYAYKNNDPHESNSYNYNPGQGMILNANVFTEGIGFSLNLHHVDNMDSRSQRDALKTNLLVNFIAPLTKQHIYRLASIYPYSSQLNGEAGLQAELTYKIPKNTFLGGKYGTSVNLNYSIVKELDTTATLMDPVKGLMLRYDSPFFKTGNKTYFHDFNIEVRNRLTERVELTAMFMNFEYDRNVLVNHKGHVDGNILVFEVNWHFAESKALRTEIQHLWSKQDTPFESPDYTYGNWFMFLAEYTIAPAWYFSVWDDFNYFTTEAEGQKIDRSLHYLNGSIAFVHNITRISLSYGRQREGILCVGGVCRQVPPANGISLSVSSSF